MNYKLILAAILFNISIVTVCLQLSIALRLCYYAAKDVFLYLTTGDESTNLLAEYIMRITYYTESTKTCTNIFGLIARMPLILIHKFVDPYKSPSILVLGYYVSINIFGAIAYDTLITGVKLVSDIIPMFNI